MRSAIPSRASSRGTPSRVSTSTRLNSPAIGSCPSRTTVSTDWARERPADRLPDDQLQGVGQAVVERLQRASSRLRRSHSFGSRPAQRRGRASMRTKLAATEKQAGQSAEEDQRAVDAAATRRASGRTRHASRRAGSSAPGPVAVQHRCGRVLGLVHGRGRLGLVADGAGAAALRRRRRRPGSGPRPRPAPCAGETRRPISRTSSPRPTAPARRTSRSVESSNSGLVVGAASVGPAGRGATDHGVGGGVVAVPSIGAVTVTVASVPGTSSGSGGGDQDLPGERRGLGGEGRGEGVGVGRDDLTLAGVGHRLERGQRRPATGPGRPRRHRPRPW